MRAGTAVTFFTNSPRWGIAYGQVASTHLFNYSDLGIALVNGVLAEQPDSPGIRTAVVIDPGSIESQEIEAARTSLTNSGVLNEGASQE